eukprot:5318970-Lingulodinium_polyedra.AAC.1
MQEGGQRRCRSRNAQTGSFSTHGGFSWRRPTGVRSGRNRCCIDRTERACSVTGVLWASDRVTRAGVQGAARVVKWKCAETRKWLMIDA